MVLEEFGHRGQNELAQSKVAVIGLSAVGKVSSLCLALAGVGNLQLAYQDTVELRNLHRQILHSTDDLDYPKVETSANRLGKVNPLVETEPIPENVNAGNVEEILSGMDCVVDGLDNMHNRYLVNHACAKPRILYVLGAAIGIEENLSLLAPPETLCLRTRILARMNTSKHGSAKRLQGPWGL